MTYIGEWIWPETIGSLYSSVRYIRVRYSQVLKYFYCVNMKFIMSGFTQFEIHVGKSFENNDIFIQHLP